jgi:ankyrin repeat protein
VTGAGLVLAAVVAASASAADRPLGDQLASAIERGDLRVVQELVEDGASVDTPITYGEHSITPLIKAADAGKLAIVKFLLKGGANVNARGSADGQTALMNAVTRGFDDVVEALLAAGADVKVRDTRGNSAFGLAVFGAKLEIADLLLAAKGGDPNEADPSTGITPLLGAASTGGEETIRWLVARGAKVNKITQLEYGGTTALTTAARVGNAENVRVLLELGADPRLEMKSGATALSQAQESGDAETVALIEAALSKPAPPPKK